MTSSNLTEKILTISSFDKYEKFKLETEILKQLAREIISQHKLPSKSLEIFADGTNIVFAHGDNLVIKIFPSFHFNQFERELLVLNHLQGKTKINIPTIVHHGEIYGWFYIIMSRLQGINLEGLWKNLNHNNKIIIIRQLGELIAQIHLLPTEGLEKIDCHWPEFIVKQIKFCPENHRLKKLSENLIAEIPTFIDSVKKSLLTIKKLVILTGEYTPMNLLVKQQNGIWHIDGLIDFADSMLGRAEYDLLGPGLFLIQGDKRLLKEFLISYNPDLLTPKLSHQLMALTLLHQHSNLDVQIRIKDWQQKISSLKDLKNLVWKL
jgi:hygromycin-B 7''-O-kinase